MAALVNSGSRRDQPRPESLQSKKIGCMSGLFHLLHSSSRKRITSARREANTKTAEYVNVSTRRHKLPKTATSRHKSRTTFQGGQARTIRLPGNIDGGDITPPIPARLQQHHISCNGPRSPTLAPELRRSNSVDSPCCRQEAAQSCLRRSPVAKLMGLDDMHSSTPAAAYSPKCMEKEAAAEKRRKLLGALEKCDEDLQALKKIIEAIKKAEIISTNATGNDMDDAALISSTNCKSRSCHSEADDQDKEARHNLMDVKATGGQLTMRLDCSGRSTTSEPGKCMGETKKQWEEGTRLTITTYGGYDQQPSPVSVLDGSALLFSSPQVLLLTPPLKVGDEYKRHSKKVGKDESFLERINIVAQATSALLAPRRRGEPLVAACRRRTVRLSGSKAMRETVNEVWMEGIWGQGWELGRVGVVVESDIFGELVAELVKELHSCCTLVTRIKRYMPPFEVCRKRLSF